MLPSVTRYSTLDGNAVVDFLPGRSIDTGGNAVLASIKAAHAKMCDKVKRSGLLLMLLCTTTTFRFLK